MGTYKLGDIVAVQFPFTDISQSKKRPALVLSNEIVNQTDDYLLVQITSQIKNDGFSIYISPEDYLDLSLPLKSYLRVHKVFLLNESLISNRITEVNPLFLKLVSEHFIKLIE